MYSLRALLLALLLTVLQFVLSVDAKGGGKGGGSKSSKTSKSKKKPVILQENGKCYNEQHVEVECPPKKNTALILGIVIAVIGAILILLLAIWFFKRRSQNKKKGLDAKSRGLDDASSDHESIMPLVLGDTKDKDSEYSYEDKGANV